jgi:hypothetical protein
MSEIRVDVALVHSPVVNKKGEIIGSAVTNLDLHDIARACRTFGVDTYWVITPFAQQQELAAQIVGHWIEGYGKLANPDRGNALSRIRIRGSLEDVIGETHAKWGSEVQVVATCARPQQDTSGYQIMRKRIIEQQPVLLLFGTAWGLAPEVFTLVDATLPPIEGTSGYNHLSVRSAVSIILDRLLGKREE